ncbi:MAG: xanthine phosphoribosyltransferase [Firmicutes bacterium]|nr:xanthine phosphoribosyltransferase [Bacillota bacterium]
MQLMEDMILREGKVLPGGILKVGSFLNQQIDPALLRAVGDEIAAMYEGKGTTKILTIESSGIAIAAAAGIAMGVPVLFAKKHKTSNVDGEVYKARVHSFTHGNDYDAVVSRDFLSSDDKVILVDDFLASGNALKGLLKLSEEAGAEVLGAVVAIEKRFQGGGDELRAEGLRVDALALIESMDDSGVTFGEIE